MKRLEALKQLKRIVKREVLAQSKYCTDGKNCVVGHLLLMGGMTNTHLEEMDNGKYGSYSINRILMKVKDMPEDIVHKTLTDLGFDVVKDNELLAELQDYNDSGQADYLINKLDELIVMEENK